MSGDCEPLFLSRRQVMSLHLRWQQAQRASAAITFLILNGCSDQSDNEVVYAAMIEIAKRQMNKTGLAAVFRRQFPRI